MTAALALAAGELRFESRRRTNQRDGEVTRQLAERALDLGPRSNKTVVADYIFEKDKLFACLNLNDQELETYNRYYNFFREQLPTPDLVIYLQATPEVLKKRLKKKNAPGEKPLMTTTSKK